MSETSATSPLNVAVIGLGWVAQARHIPALQRNPGCRLVGVIDRDASRAASIADRLNLPYYAASTELRDVPWLEQVQALTIAAPPMAHCSLVSSALALGKHVLVEKPFAMSDHEGRAMLAAAQTSERVLAVVHNFQFSRAMRRIEVLLSSGRLGTVRWIAARQLGNPRRRLPSWYKTLPLGLFYDESPHFYYLLRKLAGELTLQDAVARGRAEDDQTPDEIRLLYRGDHDVPVSIDCQFNSPLSEWHVVVGGSEALAVVDIFRDFCLFLPQDGVHGLSDILRTSLSASLQHWAQYIPNGLAFLRGRLDYGNDEVIRRFITACRSGQAPEAIGAADALAVLGLQQQVLAQLRWL